MDENFEFTMSGDTVYYARRNGHEWDVYEDPFKPPVIFQDSYVKEALNAKRWNLKSPEQDVIKIMQEASLNLGVVFTFNDGRINMQYNSTTYDIFGKDDILSVLNTVRVVEDIRSITANEDVFE